VDLKNYLKKTAKLRTRNTLRRSLAELTSLLSASQC
jgi:hypothetical protein